MDLLLKAIEAKLQSQKDIIPLRLQAYERLTVFLERISLNNLLGRVYQPGLTVREFHLELLSSIRAEFEHNISQQIYVSQEVWNSVRSAREEIVKIINTAASSIDPNAKGAELSKIIFENLMKDENNRGALSHQRRVPDLHSYQTVKSIFDVLWYENLEEIEEIISGFVRVISFSDIAAFVNSE